MNTEREPAHEQTSGLLKTLTRRRDALRAKVQAERSPIAIPSPALERIEREIAQARHTLAPMRAAHASALRESFREPCRDAAVRALAAAKELDEAVQEISAMNAEVRRAGGVVSDIDTKMLKLITLPLRKLAGEPQ
jgi:hypothetical protein